MAAASRSPSAANASTHLPPDWRTLASGNGIASSLVPVSSSNSRSAASAEVSPASTAPLGIIHAPASLLRQNGPPGLISRTSVRSSRSRKSRIPALGGGIHRAHRRRRFRDPAPAKQARSLVEDRRLARSDAKFQ